MTKFEMATHVGTKEETYRTIDGYAVRLRARGTKAEFEWRDAKGKRVGKRLETEDSLRANSFQIAIRLSGYGSLSPPSLNRGGMSAMMASMSPIPELTRIQVRSDSIRDLYRQGRTAEFDAEMVKFESVMQAVRLLAITTLGLVETYLPRDAWLKQPESLVGKDWVATYDRPRDILEEI